MTHKRELIQNLCKRPIAFNPAFVPIGGICGALMLSQAIYWSERTKDPNGWFYKTQKQWQAETGMNRTEQEKARRALKSAGVLEERLSGVPAKLHYKVDFETLYAAIADDAKRDDPAGSSLWESNQLDCADPSNKLAGNEQTNTETTAEKSGPNGPGAGAPPDDLSVGIPSNKQKGTLTRDARARMWRMGVELLTGQGMAESTARSLIGKWAKNGEAKVASVIGKCAVKAPADARAYIQAAVQSAYNLYDEKQLRAAAKAYNVPAKSNDTYDSWRERVREAMRGRATA